MTCYDILWHYHDKKYRSRNLRFNALIYVSLDICTTLKPQLPYPHATSLFSSPPSGLLLLVAGWRSGNVMFVCKSTRELSCDPHSLSLRYIYCPKLVKLAWVMEPSIDLSSAVTCCFVVQRFPFVPTRWTSNYADMPILNQVQASPSYCALLRVRLKRK